MIDAPGFPFRRLVDELGDADLRQLTAGAARYIEILGGRDLKHKELVDLVLEVHAAPDLLRSSKWRAKLLAGLPQEKKEELVSRIGGPMTVADLMHLQMDRSGKEESALFAFFGYNDVVGRSQSASPQTIRTIRPEYGLFSYQRRAVDEVKTQLNQFPRRTVLHLPTGAGKTRSAMHVVCSELAGRVPTVVVWLAYNNELLEQAASEFERAWNALGNRDIDVYRFWGTAEADLESIEDGFVVAGLSKLYAAYSSNTAAVLHLADKVTLTVFDEAHQAVAPTYRELAQLFSSKRPDGKLFGLTATPGRTWADIGADEELAEFFGRRKVTLQVEGFSNPVTFLINAGYLARPTFNTLNVDAGMKLTNADRQAMAEAIDVPVEMLERLGDSEQYTARVIETVVALTERHERLIVFASSVQQSKTIAAVLHSLGIWSSSLTAETPDGQRSRMINNFRSNAHRPMVLVNYGVLTAGFDAPKTSCAVIARPTKSLVLFSQMVGRAIRGKRAGGNEACEIVTVVDPTLPGFGDVADAFTNWEDVWE